MSDENGEALFNPQAGGDGAGTPSQPPVTPSAPPEEPGEEGQEPKYVTEDALSKALDDVRREVQSSRDKALSTFDKRYAEKLKEVDRIVEYNKQAKIPMTPEQERALRMQALDEASKEAGAGQPSGQPGVATPAADQEQITKEVNAWAARQSQQAGIQLEKEDPEVALLDHSSPEAFKESFKQALYQKRLRAGATATPPEARIPSLGQPVGRPNPGMDAQFVKEYKAARSKGLTYARSIREKYAAKGVDVNGLIAKNFN